MSSTIKMTTAPSNLFRNSLVLIDEADGRVIDVLTHQHDNTGNLLENTDQSNSTGTRSGNQPADWTSSDISLRTINKAQPLPTSSVDGIPENAPTSRFLSFQRNEDFARTLTSRPYTAGWRRTTFYTDARTSVASFFTAYDDHDDNDHATATNEVDRWGARQQVSDLAGDQDKVRGGRGDRKSVELFSRPHPDDVSTRSDTDLPEKNTDFVLQVITQSDHEVNDTSPEAAPDTAYLDRFWANLFATTERAKTDGPWIVTVSVDMSKWFLSRSVVL
jgi:hypothetical protein